MGAGSAAALRLARLAFAVAAIMAQAVSLGLLCGAVPAGAGLAGGAAALPALALQVTRASFLVSHITPAGSVTGSVLNISMLETEGIAPVTTADAIGVTSLVSSIPLIALFGAGLAATAGRGAGGHLPDGSPPRARGAGGAPTRRRTSPARSPSPPAASGSSKSPLVAITAGFGAPRATAVVATLAYRLLNYWLPLPFGVVAYLRLRLGAVDRRPDKPRPAGSARYQRPGRRMTAMDDMPPQLPWCAPDAHITQFPGHSIDI